MNLSSYRLGHVCGLPEKQAHVSLLTPMTLQFVVFVVIHDRDRTSLHQISFEGMSGRAECGSCEVSFVLSVEPCMKKKRQALMQGL